MKRKAKRDLEKELDELKVRIALLEARPAFPQYPTYPLQPCPQPQPYQPWTDDCARIPYYQGQPFWQVLPEHYTQCRSPH